MAIMHPYLHRLLTSLRLIRWQYYMQWMDRGYDAALHLYVLSSLMSSFYSMHSDISLLLLLHTLRSVPSPLNIPELRIQNKQSIEVYKQNWFLLNGLHLLLHAIHVIPNTWFQWKVLKSYIVIVRFKVWRKMSYGMSMRSRTKCWTYLVHFY